MNDYIFKKARLLIQKNLERIFVQGLNHLEVAHIHTPKTLMPGLGLGVCWISWRKNRRHNLFKLFINTPFGYVSN